MLVMIRQRASAKARRYQTCTNRPRTDMYQHAPRADRYRKEPGIVRFKVKTEPMWYPVTLTWPANQPHTEEARRFAEFLKQNIPEGYFNTELEAYLHS